MQEYLKPENLGEKSDTCPVCSINLYGTTVKEIADKKVVGQPVVMPCNVRGNEITKGKPLEKGTDRKPARYNCPFEEGKEIPINDDLTLRLTGGNEGSNLI